VVRVVDSETVEVALETGRALVHLACLDGPEERNRFPELAYFGQETESVLAALLEPGAAVCVVEEGERPVTDAAGHRISYLRFPDRRDVGAELVRRGYGVARDGPCALRAHYRELERQAVAAEVGHWGPTANQVAVAVVANALAFHAVGPPRRAGGGG
jgi:endonuclease YncB( thermonuclease family)